MAKYQAIDDSCDSSALLGIIINIDEFPVAVRSNAEKIRSNIRNPRAHCNLQEWDKGKFATSFTEMGNFISSLDLKASVKQSTLDEITKWETNDAQFLKGTILGLELVKEIRQETSVLAKYAKVLKFNLEDEIEKRAAADKVIQDELMTLKEKIKDIDQRQEEIIPKHIRDCHEDEIRGWEKDDETFVETRATKHVMTWISKCNIAVVTGSSGAGKSFLIHHVALELHRQKNYDIIPLSFVTAPSDIMKYYSKNKNQVFVIDDICGKGTMDVRLVNTWKDLTEKLNDMFKSDCTETKLLISCRLQVFNDSQFKGLTRFTANVFDIVSEPLCLLPEERLLMIKKYLKSDKIDLVINDLCYFDFFPLLCKMSKNISFERLPLFLKSPIDTIKQHIKHIKDSENKHQLCALVLSILFEEGFKEDWLGNLKAVPKIITVKLKENNTTLSIESYPTDEFIVLPEEMEETYFERLVDDLKQWDIYSTLHNNQLVHDSFRKKLISYLQQNAEDLKTIFCQIDRNGIKLLTREYHFSIGYDFDDKEVNVTFPLIEAAIEGYADIVEFLLKMNCNVNKIDSFHRSALYKACEGGYHDVVNILINHNADASLCHEDGYSSLHMACKAGNTNIVKLMLDKNADVNSVSRFGDTPLSLACEGGYGDIVKELLQNKAQVVGVPASKSSLCLACKTGNEDILNMLLAANKISYIKTNINGMDIYCHHVHI
ncbi:ANKRD17 [Mytilus coruscus]|uniref:ANKRD17 n=1 Tax=Mytilus coruscus TaxID=42192 RepID=A0A6J8CL02_MYTCO|nr:ANKRD17 [Mytilus coruscus]